MVLKIPVYLPTNDDFSVTDAKSSRQLQEPEKIIKLFETRYKVFTRDISSIG